MKYTLVVAENDRLNNVLTDMIRKYETVLKDLERSEREIGLLK